MASDALIVAVMFGGHSTVNAGYESHQVAVFQGGLDDFSMRVVVACVGNYWQARVAHEIVNNIRASACCGEAADVF